MDQPIRLTGPSDADIPVWLVTQNDIASWLSDQSQAVQAWVASHRFQAKPGAHLILPGEAGAVAGVVLGIGDPLGLWDTAGLPAALGPGTYRLEIDPKSATQAALGWALGCYQFSRYKDPGESDNARDPALLAWPEGADRAYVERAAAAAWLVRDLVNTPADDLGPQELSEAAVKVAQAFGATSKVIVGDDLLKSKYPMIHAVGRGAAQEPRLIDLLWGDPANPAVTLVGKGVCFDSGGLDLKTANGMALMKKDMGGAATALGLAHMIMDAALPVRLRVLIPAVENAVSAASYHPGDVLTSRKGLTVEIGNTDAEGRLVLADALAEADAGAPDLLIDFATLTGSARVALGADLPALYVKDARDSADLMEIGLREDDPMWSMPLWAGYEDLIDSKIADLNNSGISPFAGSITAALFLARFVTETKRWMHLDLYAWNQKSRPGRPEGGEAQTMRAMYRLIEGRYAAG